MRLREDIPGPQEAAPPLVVGASRGERSLSGESSTRHHPPPASHLSAGLRSISSPGPRNSPGTQHQLATDAERH